MDDAIDPPIAGGLGQLGSRQVAAAETRLGQEVEDQPLETHGIHVGEVGQKIVTERGVQEVVGRLHGLLRGLRGNGSDRGEWCR